MSVYRLTPIDQNHPSWQDSSEQEGVWVGAATEADARDLAARKTAIAKDGRMGTKSPWQDPAITSCTLDPSMNHVRAGSVVRADGSLVGK